MTKKSQSTAGPTPASAWRRDYEEGILVTMPHNGRTVRLRSVSPAYLLRTNKLPEGLTEIAIGGLDLTDIAGENGDARAAEMVTKLDDYYRAVCTEALVSPRIVEDPKGDDEIAWEWLSELDKQYIEAIINAPVNEWASFRLRPNPGLESVPDGSAPEQQTE